MSILKPLLQQLEVKLSTLEKPITSHRELVMEEVIVVFAALVWLGAMVLLP